MYLKITPIVTEKSTVASTNGQYHFRVNSDATKVQIKQELEKLYGKKVSTVKSMTIRKKVREIGRNKSLTKRQAGKKVIVTFANRESIDINKTK